MSHSNLVETDPAEAGRPKRKDKKVTLIACPWTFYQRAEFLSQQLGLGYVGSYAEKCGHKIVAFIDPMIRGGLETKVPVGTKFLNGTLASFDQAEVVFSIGRTSRHRSYQRPEPCKGPDDAERKDTQTTAVTR